jgi:hypothetical protein
MHHPINAPHSLDSAVTTGVRPRHQKTDSLVRLGAPESARPHHLSMSSRRTALDSRNFAAPIRQILARAIAHAIKSTIERVFTQPGSKAAVARQKASNLRQRRGTRSFVAAAVPVSKAVSRIEARLRRA